MSEDADKADRDPKHTTIVGVAINHENGSNEHPDTAALKSLFKVALETRNFEITQLVQRNNFFMIFQGVLLAGVMQSTHSKPIVSFAICLAGFVVSIFQAQMAAGAKFWQEYWEQTLQELDKLLAVHISTSDNNRSITMQLFHDDACIYESMVKDRIGGKHNGFISRMILKRYSVSKIPIYVACFLAFVWLVLTLCTLRAYPPLSIPSFITGF